MVINMAGVQLGVSGLRVMNISLQEEIMATCSASEPNADSHQFYAKQSFQKT
jgi:hypothetical protein